MCTYIYTISILSYISIVCLYIHVHIVLYIYFVYICITYVHIIYLFCTYANAVYPYYLTYLSIVYICIYVCKLFYRKQTVIVSNLHSMLLNKHIYINNTYLIKFTMFLKLTHLSIGYTINFYSTSHK